MEHCPVMTKEYAAYWTTLNWALELEGADKRLFRLFVLIVLDLWWRGYVETEVSMTLRSRITQLPQRILWTVKNIRTALFQS